MTTRKFYKLAFEAEGQIGNAARLHSLDISGVDEAIRQAHLVGKPYSGFSTLTLNEGRPLGSLPSGVKLAVDRHSTDNLNFDVVVNGNAWKIVSNSLGSALKNVAPNDVELLPVAITGMDGETLRSDFCVVNVLQMLEVISEQKTVRSRDKESVFKLAIIGSKVPPNVHVFRTKEWPWAFLVDDIAKRALTRHPHDGLAFIPVEQE